MPDPILINKFVQPVDSPSIPITSPQSNSGLIPNFNYELPGIDSPLETVYQPNFGASFLSEEAIGLPLQMVPKQNLNQLLVPSL